MPQQQQSFPVQRTHGRPTGFSTVEAIVAVAIFGGLCAAALPHVSRGATDARDATLVRDLRLMRDALELYRRENNGALPATGRLSDALLHYHDGGGVEAAFSPTRSDRFAFGAYLRAIPPLPVGTHKGATAVGAADEADDPAVGWIYSPATGAITANCRDGEHDSGGRQFRAY